MDTTLRRALIAGLVALSVAACDRKQPEAGKASPPGPLAVQTAPAQPGSSSSGANGDRVVALPDFTPLMKSQGPVVVNVITRLFLCRLGGGSLSYLLLTGAPAWGPKAAPRRKTTR